MPVSCQDVTIERVGKQWRWTCPLCSHSDGTSGPIGSKDRAKDGAFYHSYAVRPMTVDEFRSTGDGMNAGATDEQAAARVAAWNEAYAR